MRLFLCLILVISFMYSVAPNWSYIENLTLKKDEPYLHEFSLNEEPKTLYFYWTLYKNNGLVINLIYDGFPHQFVLYKDYKRKSFKLPLIHGRDVGDDSYLLITFSDFSTKDKSASLWLGIMLPRKTN